MKKRIFYLILLIIIGASICPYGALARRQVPDNNLAYPVLITLGKSTGSGFFIEIENIVYLVTARHVLYKPTPIDIESLPKEIKIPGNLLIRLEYDQKAKMFSFHGVMSAEDKKALLQLSQDKSYRFNIEKTYKLSQTLALINEKARLLSYPADINDDSENIISLDLDRLNEGKKIKYHPKKDVAIIEIGEIIKLEEGKKVKFFQGVSLLNRTKTGILAVVEENIKLFKDAMIGNDIFLFGFPTSIGLASPEFSIKKPLIRKGILSGKNLKFRTLIIDCPVNYGNSGSLVIEMEEISLGKHRYFAIGIAIRIVQVLEMGFVEISSFKKSITYTNTGYSIVEPIDTVIELLKN